MNHEWRRWGVGIAVLSIIAAGFGVHYWYTNRAVPEEAQEQTGVVKGASDDGSALSDGMSANDTVRLNETVRIAGSWITPKEVVEDSRCPKDVQCIQAGTVRVRADVTPRGSDQSEPVLFELGVRMTVGQDQITLIDVSPAPQSGSQINGDHYIFTFSVIKGEIEYYKG